MISVPTMTASSTGPAGWRLELPFLEKQLKAANARRILDAACGTGMHAIALAKLGFEVAGADLSEKMIERAEVNAKSAGVSVQFKAVGFGELNAAFGSQSFDALLCLGNSLPHLLSENDLQKALADFVSCLKPGGLLIIQNRNFDAVMKNRQRWMEPQSTREGNNEWLFLRFYDFEPDGSDKFQHPHPETAGRSSLAAVHPVNPITSHPFTRIA